MKVLNISCGFFLINTIAGLGYGIVCPIDQLTSVMVATMLSAFMTQIVWLIRRDFEKKGYK